MTSANQERQVFVIRIWRECQEREDQPAQWRGQIEAIENGEQRYLKNLEEIVVFIIPYLEEMGVNVDARWQTSDKRITQWLNRRK